MRTTEPPTAPGGSASRLRDLLLVCSVRCSHIAPSSTPAECGREQGGAPPCRRSFASATDSLCGVRSSTASCWVPKVRQGAVHPRAAGRFPSQFTRPEASYCLSLPSPPPSLSAILHEDGAGRVSGQSTDLTPLDLRRTGASRRRSTRSRSPPCLVRRRPPGATLARLHGRVRRRPVRRTRSGLPSSPRT